MFRKIDYVLLWVKPVLNSSWNGISYYDKVCIVFFISFITCFTWYCFWPPSTEVAFPFFFIISAWFHRIEVIILMVVMEAIDVWWGFGILQMDLFSLIWFLCLEFQFHFAMPHFCCFRFALLQVPQYVRFYSYYDCERCLKLSF